jgi:hypothetical protein
MKKLISFCELKKVCDRQYLPAKKPYFAGCIDIDNENDKCSQKNCPIWKRLKGEK